MATTWLSALVVDIAANRPMVADVPPGHVGLFLASDTGVLSVYSVATGWADVLAGAVRPGDTLVVLDLPAGDPVSAGALWNNGGVVNVSTGS